MLANFNFLKLVSFIPPSATKLKFKFVTMFLNLLTPK